MENLMHKILFRICPSSCRTVNRCKFFPLKAVHSGIYHQTFSTALPMSFTIYVYVPTQFETSRSISKNTTVTLQSSPYKVDMYQKAYHFKNHCAKVKFAVLNIVSNVKTIQNMRKYRDDGQLENFSVLEGIIESNENQKLDTLIYHTLKVNVRSLEDF